MRGHLSSACRSLLVCLLVLPKGKFLCLFLVLVLRRSTRPGPCTLPKYPAGAVYFCRGRDLGGLLRRKVDRGLAKYRRGVAEAVLCKYRGLLSAKSPEKITPKAQVALATTKTSQLRSSRTSHRSTRPGNEVAGSLRIQIRNYVIFWRTWHSQQLYCRSQSLTLIPLALHAPQHGHLFVPAPRTCRSLRSQVDDSRHLGDISPTRLGVRSRSRRWRAQADLAGLADQRPSTRSDAHTLSQTRSTRSIWTASYFLSRRRADGARRSCTYKSRTA